jgi:hypothetical protein
VRESAETFLLGFLARNPDPVVVRELAAQGTGAAEQRQRDEAQDEGDVVEDISQL